MQGVDFSLKKHSMLSPHFKDESFSIPVIKKDKMLLLLDFKVM